MTKQSANGVSEDTLQDRFSAVLATAVDGIVIIDEIGTVEEFNPSCERMFGYGSSEVLGRNIRMLMPEPYQSGHDGYLQNYRETGDRKIIGIGRTVSGRRKNGSVFPMELSVAETTHNSRRIFVGIIRDITQRQLAELRIKQSEERFRDFAEAASDWYWETDAAFRFSYISRSVSETMGLPQEAFLGHTLPEVIASSHREDWRKHEADIQATRPFKNYTYQIESPTRGIRTFRISGKPLFDHDDTFVGYRGVGSDISDEVLNVLRLREARDQADAASTAKSHFLATMSHELRTPLNAVIGFTDALMSGIAGRMSDQQTTYVAHVHTAGRQLLGLVNEILDLSKIQAGQYQISIADVRVREILSYAVSMVRPMAIDGEVRTRISDAPETLTLKADDRALRQAVLNIVSNAVKFSLPGGRVDLSARRSSEGVMISVSDAGIGIKADDMSTLGQPFHQIDSQVARKHAGTGLGLAITRGLMTLHGGTMEIESEFGKGTTVRLWFPDNQA
jgi:PAS domain S-box-containing protein